MSSLKYDNDTSKLILEKLKNAETCVRQGYLALSKYNRSLPTKDEVVQRIEKLSKEEDDYGNEIASLTQNNYDYYMNNFGTALINAKTNLTRMYFGAQVVESNIISVDEKIQSIDNLVSNFDDTQLESDESETKLNIEDEVPFDSVDGGNGRGDGDNSAPDIADVVPTEGDGTGDSTPDKDPKKPTDINVDTDGDGKPDLNIDINGDGIPDINVDTDGDGKPDLNIDTNGDNVPDVNVDTNGDGKPDLNIDTNGDNVPDVNVDTNKDGKPDLNIDTNGDNVPDVNVDTNKDGKPDLNIDTNGDNVPDVNVDTNKDGKPDLNIDTNHDGVPDVNIDTNGDGKPDINLDLDGDGYADTNIDINGDGKPDINVDTDGDGKPDKNVIPGYEHNSGNNGSFLDDLLKRMKLQVDDDGNIMYYDENGNIVYPFLGDGIFADPSNAQKFKAAQNSFLEMLDGPERGDAVESLDLELEKNVSSAGLAVGGMVAVGAAAANAAATMKRTKDEINDGIRVYDYEYDDDAKLTPEQYKKRKIGTIISMVLLTLLILGNAIALIISSTSDVTIVLLGLAISITAIITSMGIKLGKFYTVCATLVNLLIVYILTCLGFTSNLGYIIAFAVLIVILLYYYFTKIFERILPMFNYVPAVVGIVAIGFVGLLSVFEITHWIVSLILLILIIAGYFAYNYYGIAQLEEQLEYEKQKGLSIYDYFNLKTNRKKWKYQGNINDTDILPVKKEKQTNINDVEIPIKKVEKDKTPLFNKNTNKQYGKHGDNKFLEYMDNNQKNNKSKDNNNNSKFFS